MGQDIGIVRMLEKDYPGRTFAVIPVGGVDLPPGLTPPVRPDYRKFDRALKTQARPVLVPLDRSPFRDFSAEEFMGNTVFNCRGPGGCRSIFQGSNRTLSANVFDNGCQYSLSNTFAEGIQWFEDHPRIEIVTRNR